MFKPLAKSLSAGLVSLSAMFALPALLHAEQAVESNVGRGARVFITKTYPGHGKLTEADFRQLADAGFTVAVDMWIEDVPAFVKNASKVGLASMTWNMGMPDADEGDNIDRTMTRLGKHTRFVLPYSRAGWARITELMVGYARLSLEQPGLKGALLDYEIYDENRTDGFCESYDDASFTEFMKQQGRKLPETLPPPEERRAYLDNLQILSLYVDWQAKMVGERAREMRQAIDAVNPRFQIGVYGWGAFKDSIMRNVATEAAPVLDIDANLYGRTIWSNAFEGGYDADEPDQKALKWGITMASTLAREARARNYPAVLLSGHYPQSPGPKDGSQYKFTVRQSFNSVAYGDGYWIWTDWNPPEPWTDKQAWIDAMMVYWKESNAALERGDWTWSARQTDVVPNPTLTAARYLLTTDGKTVKVWNPLTGKQLEPVSAVEFPKHNPATVLAGKALRIDGWVVRPVQGKTPEGYNVGTATRAVAMADVDRIEGDEVVTLNMGWIKVWDPETKSQLLRFQVGDDQTDMAIVDASAVKLADQ